MDRGSTILARYIISEQPSILAASSISSGIFSKKERMTSRLYVLIKAGSHSAKYESIRP
ncbi:hypothetical protein D3C72_2568290 [compost metagenome]